MERVARILEDDPRPRVAAVLSACRGVTDALLALVTAAERQEDGDAGRLEAIRQRHVGIAEHSARSRGCRGVRRGARPPTADDIAGILQTVRLIRIASPVVRDLVAGFGEIWSTRLFARYLQARGPARRRRALDRRAGDRARSTRRRSGRASSGPSRAPTPTASSRRMPDATLIITGFIARTREGLQTTLGRDGSDFSGIDLRRAARRVRDRHLDRRRRRAERRSAPRPRCDRHRLALLQRGDGARLLRREGDPSADDGAGRQPGDPDLDPQHVRARRRPGRSSARSRCRRIRSRGLRASTRSP